MHRLYRSIVILVVIAPGLAACTGDHHESRSNGEPCHVDAISCTGIDPNFGMAGVATYRGLTGGAAGSTIAVDSSDRIVVAGGDRSGQMVIWRCDSSGALDRSFGSGGVARFEDPTGQALRSVAAMCLDSSGRILVAGSGYDSLFRADMLIWRIDPSGMVHPSFGIGGVVVYDHPGVGDSDEEAVAIAMDSLGMILVGGTTRPVPGRQDMLIWRYDSAGSLDTAFGTGGVVTQGNTGGENEYDYAEDLVVDSSDRIIVVGTTGTSATGRDLVILRYDTAGVLDPTFGNGGIVIHDRSTTSALWEFGTAVTLDGSGRILVAGNRLSDTTVWRFDSSGALDPTFGNGGIATHVGPGGQGDYDWPRSIAVDPSGRIVIAGTGSTNYCNSEMAIWRFDGTGAADPTFGCEGVFSHSGLVGSLGSDEGMDVSLDSAGRILVTGWGESAAGLRVMAIWRVEG